MKHLPVVLLAILVISNILFIRKLHNSRDIDKNLLRKIQNEKSNSLNFYVNYDKHTHLGMEQNINILFFCLPCIEVKYHIYPATLNIITPEMKPRKGLSLFHRSHPWFVQIAPDVILYENRDYRLVQN